MKQELIRVGSTHFITLHSGLPLWNAALFSVQIPNDAAQLNPVGVIDFISV
jgi:hypothetical protein